MKKYKKVTYEMKERIRILRNKGISLVEIGKDLGVAPSTVSYHSSEKQRMLAIERSKRNEKKRDRREYNKEYQSERYRSDPEYRERIRKDNRENWRRKHGAE